MIHPHSLYKRISPQVTGHLYEKDMEHRDQIVCSSSVTTRYHSGRSVKGRLADQVFAVCGVALGLRHWPWTALSLAQAWLGTCMTSFSPLIFCHLCTICKKGVKNVVGLWSTDKLSSLQTADKTDPEWIYIHSHLLINKWLKTKLAFLVL